MQDINTQLVLISGESGSGKSASLRNLPNQERWMYLNCEAGKRLPFRNKFWDLKITDPYQIHEAFSHATNNIPEKVDGIIIDTITFMMAMFESVYIYRSVNSQQGWGDYFQFFANLMQDYVVKFDKPTIMLGHTRSELNEAKMIMETKVPVKGALQNQGVEAFFSTVVSTKKVAITELEKYGSDLLTITDEERELGYKHVFQTRPTKATVGERIRSPMGLFTKEQTYMDNDAQLLLDHLRKYYA